MMGYWEEKKEADRLVREIKRSNWNVRHSGDVSKYIVKRHVQGRYSHIAGHVGMSDNRKNWTYKGGISPKWYRYVCDQLDTDSQGTDTHATDFTPYSDMHHHSSSRRYSNGNTYSSHSNYQNSYTSKTSTYSRSNLNSSWFLSSEGASSTSDEVVSRDESTKNEKEERITFNILDYIMIGLFCFILLGGLFFG